MKCRNCDGESHPGWTCLQAEARAKQASNEVVNMVVNTLEPETIGSSLASMVVHNLDSMVVHAPKAEPVVVHEVVHEVVHASKHGKYADAEKRRAYRREWMNAKRAAG